MGVNPGGDGGTCPPHEFSGGEMSPHDSGLKSSFFFLSSSLSLCVEKNQAKSGDQILLIELEAS